MQFPDVLVLDSLRLPLTYHLEPGHPQDGVTVTIPVTAINQAPADRFDWLVPGLLEEKAVELIRSLPKSLRVNFVPAPDFAQRAAEAIPFAQGKLTDALGWELGRLTGVQIPPDAWQPQSLPDYLKMNFKIIDSAGKTLTTGRDLEEIRRQLSEQVRQNFALLPPSKWNREPVTSWDFGDLPAQVEIRHYGLTLTGYPALVDLGDRCALRLFASPQAADAHLRPGVRRLFMLQMAEEMKWVGHNLPNFQQLSLHYSTLGPGVDLKRDLIELIADRSFLADRPPVRTQMEFELRLDWGWNRLSPMTSEVCQLAGEILSAYHAVTMDLAEPHGPLWAEALSDIRQQLTDLLPKGFWLTTPYEWLKHYPRYFKAIQLRLKRLTNFGFAKDAQAAAQLAPLWQSYRQRLDQHRQQGTCDPELTLYRWMLEELRVSLFAQELKTAVPVSLKKLEAQWAKVKGV